MRSTVLSRLCVTAACASLAACAGVKQASSGGGSDGTSSRDGSAGTGNHPDGSPFDFGTGVDIVITPQHSLCGDGVRSQDEACDDGNGRPATAAPPTA